MFPIFKTKVSTKIAHVRAVRGIADRWIRQTSIFRK